MKILITGICGFLGSVLTRYLLEAKSDITIYGIDNLMRPGSEINRSELVKVGVRLFHGDIRIQSDFESIPEVDWVIDAAATPCVLAGVHGWGRPRQLMERNSFGTGNMLEFCK